MFCDNLEGWKGVWREVLEGGDEHIIMTDLSCCAAEANTIL